MQIKQLSLSDVRTTSTKLVLYTISFRCSEVDRTKCLRNVIGLAEKMEKFHVIYVSEGGLQNHESRYL